jgi:hypothetical protein
MKKTKLTITVTHKDAAAQLFYAELMAMTTVRLKDLMRARNVPIPKTKDAMALRLAAVLVDEPITLTIG